MYWFDKCTNRIHTKICTEIRNVTNNAQSTSRFLAKWVDKVWKENCEHVINLNYCIELIAINQKHIYNLV